MAAGRVYVNFNDGSSGWHDPATAAKIVANGDGKVAGKVRMRVVTENGNTITRDFSGARVPPQWQDQGAVVEPGDAEVKDTSLLGSFANNIGHSIAGTLPSAASMAPLAIPGAGVPAALTRLGVGFASGTAADMGVKALRGEPQNIPASMVSGGVNAAIQAPFEAASLAIPHLPEPVMKAALGNAAPGMEAYALERGQVVSPAGLRARQAAIDASTATADAAIAASTKKFPRAPFIRLLRSMKGEAGQADVLSRSQESTLADALGVAQAKMGPKVTTTKAGRILGANGQPIQPATTTVTPRPDMSAAEVDKIRRLADNEAKALRKAREANKDKKVGDLEGAYLQVSKLASRMLRTIPGVKASRLSAHRDIGLGKAVFDATKRGHSAGLSTAIGSSVGLPAAFMTHDPMAAALGVPVATAHYLATSPEALSRMALGLNNPRLAPAVRGMPKVFQAAAADALMRNQK